MQPFRVSYQTTGSYYQDDDEDKNRVNNKHITNNYSCRDSLKAASSTFDQSVSSRDGIKFTHVIVLGRTSCSMGSVDAEDSQLNDVDARDGIALQDSFAKNLSTSMGKVSWKNSKPMEAPAESIQARDGIKLTQVHCNGLIAASMGSIEAGNCLLSEVSARDGVELSESTAHFVSTSMGKLKVENTKAEHPFVALEARDGVRIKNIIVERSVKCSMGKIQALGCHLNHVHARDGAVLENTGARHCEVSMGTLHVICSDGMIRQYETLTARDGLVLAGLEASGSVSSSLGKLEANGCRFKDIQAYKTIQLEQSKCQNATVVIGKGDKRATVSLNGSEIEGDLTVFLDPSISASGSFGGSVMSMMQGSKSLNISGGNYIVNGYSSSELSFLPRLYSLPDGATGLIDGVPHTIKGGRFVSLAIQDAASSSSAKEEMEVVIQGGIVRGKVIFKDCAGKIVLEGGAQVQGKGA